MEIFLRLIKAIGIIYNIGLFLFLMTGLYFVMKALILHIEGDKEIKRLVVDLFESGIWRTLGFLFWITIAYPITVYSFFKARKNR